VAAQTAGRIGAWAAHAERIIYPAVIEIAASCSGRASPVRAVWPAVGRVPQAGLLPVPDRARRGAGAVERGGLGMRSAPPPMPLHGDKVFCGFGLSRSTAIPFRPDL